MLSRSWKVKYVVFLSKIAIFFSFLEKSCFFVIEFSAAATTAADIRKESAKKRQWLNNKLEQEILMY